MTALGDEVNEAARIEACASGGRMLASKNLIERLDPHDAAALDIDPDHLTYTRLGRPVDGDREGPPRRPGHRRLRAVGTLRVVASVLLAATGYALVLALTGCNGTSRTSGATAPNGSTYTLMQMNLCLSGFAGCFGKVAYPAGVEEAVARIGDAHPDR